MDKKSTSQSLICIHRRTVFTKVESVQLMKFVIFEVFTAVTMKKTVFWDVTPCNMVDAFRSIGGKWWLHLQGRRSPNYSDYKSVYMMSHSIKLFSDDIGSYIHLFAMSNLNIISWRFHGLFGKSKFVFLCNTFLYE
jgi:hypothetical protein